MEFRAIMRLFVALDLPRTVRQRLADLATGVSGVRWVPPENYHVTIRFVGELPAYKAEELDLALADIRARRFTLELAGVGTLDRAGRVTALWAGVASNPALLHLRAKVDTAVQRAGMAAERRRYMPHVTLARLGEQVEQARVAAWVQSHNLFRSAPMDVGHFTLFTSVLGPDQPVYTPEVEYPLG